MDTHARPAIGLIARAAKGASHRALSERFFDTVVLENEGRSARVAKVQVLVLDDWALAPLNERERRGLLEIIDDRYGCGSTIVTSQLDSTLWHDQLGDPTIADAVCDRLIHNAHMLVLKGPSGGREESAARK